MSKNHCRRIHVLLGTPGYPVMMLRAEDHFRKMKVQHHERDVKVGDGMVVGRSIDQATTYAVTSNTRKGPSTWEATLERCDFVVIAGEVYYRDALGPAPSAPRQHSVFSDDFSA